MALLAACSLPVISPAATLVVEPDIGSGGYWRLDSTSASQRSATQDSNVGNNSGTEVSTATTYLLPDLNGESIDSVQLDIWYRRTEPSATEPTGALFVRTDASTTLTNADFLAPAEYTGDTGAWTAIQLDYIPNDPTDDTGLSLSSSGQANLKSFLDSYYSSNPTGGDYLIANWAMDLNGAAAPGSNDKWDLYATESGSATGTVQPLTIVTVPEPATTVLVLAGLGTVLLGRRRRLARVSA